jgi:arylsulfatase A-like enzyme
VRTLLLLGICCSLAARPADAPPNVVLIVADDQGWGDLSLHGNTNVRTPHLDQLARSGAQCERFFVQPVCSPTRAELLTGRYHPRGGVRDVSTGGERLHLREVTLADELRRAGYATGCFGKWHNGTQYPYHPRGRGFDTFYGFTSGHWGDYFGPPLDRDGQPVRGHGFLADDLTQQANAFMTAHRDRPFLAYVAYNTPHSPMQVPDAYWERFKSAELKLRGTGAEDLLHTRAALAMCENLDDNVGRLVKHLAELELTTHTIVIYLTDNGPNGARWNGGMKGRKGSTDEGGVRSPFFVSWPGQVPAARRVPGIAAAIDVLPTVLALTNVPRTGTLPLDGVSVAPALRTGTLPERTLFQTWNGRISARTAQYRFDAEGKLFDMHTDPQQRTDVSGQQPATTTALRQAVEQWRQQVLAEVKANAAGAFAVGYPQLPRTELPARDGVGHGSIRRSAPAPNCSYFTHWTKSADRITWEVEVQTAGTYAAEVFYTCPASRVGVVFELGLGERQASAPVTVAHDPPAFGPTNDRAPRKGESPMKDFAALALGTLPLPAGRGPLILRTPHLPGSGSVEVAGVVLTLRP